MTVFLTFVFMTVENTLAFLAALKGDTILTAFYCTLGLAALADHHYSFLLAGTTFSTVADLGAGVGAVGSTFFAAYLATRVGR